MSDGNPFERDIAMHHIKTGGTHDLLTTRIHWALRMGLNSSEHPSGSFYDRTDGITEIEGEYDLAFVASVIRSVLP